MGKSDNSSRHVSAGSKANVDSHQDVSGPFLPHAPSSLNTTTSIDGSADIRRRQYSTKPPQHTSSPTIDTTSDGLEDQTSRVISLLDVLRVLITLIGVSCALSYYLTSGSSLLWGYHPWFANTAQVTQWWKGPITLTPEELLAFDGSDPTKPIYLAINGRIFDVSAGGHTYGPGGSYSVFAGRDATRAFVTGCFLEDRTGDLRGAEAIYIPIDDPDEIITSGERKIRAEQEARKARTKVQQEVEKWEKFYQNHKKYFEVGKLEAVPRYDGPPPELCKQAMKGRPKRKNQKTHQQPEASGKPVH
ncbi:hypothetical protein PV10_01181 [Exophiala mesophila]|uniref:Cytochrome b5 heme-binding domain-containing protein n=1 Tax=Exophiala mesophila TaxID=212818 RepID=A0A0D1ZSA2_EXOME|nr:uncharacterized protein PV10_01181 [Exophiala mesophila]KIV97427.1 hypothetical protein PV10_01181 [Exophiala mesophila]